MSIYRGSGGSGDANTDATINEVTELVQDAKEYKDETATSAANAATSASNAATSESNASTSETNASSSETNAATSEANAATSETNAATSATNAAASASNASTSETNASSSASTAISAASDAAISETNASASATSASSSASTATTQADIATTKASEASTSATNAATSETNAANSATSASTSATNAANSASTASTAASNASTSESNASTSETNAAASATSASSSASSASSSATSAAGSATTATTKASEAATSASNASTSETNAATSETNAATSATNAATAQTAAESARDATLAAYDNFDDRYLGTKSTAPTVDNDGNALVAGALYFDSTSQAMFVYTGSAWVAAYVSGTGFLALTGGTMSGDINFGDNDKAIFGAGNDLRIYHDGSNSYVNDDGSGVLNIQSNGTQINLQKADGTKMIEAINNGNVVLYSNGAERIRTNGPGVDVTGTVTSDGLIVQGNSGTSSSVVFGYNEDGGEITLHDETGSAATLIDQASNNTRVIELIDGSNLVLGLGNSNTTGSIIFNKAGYTEAMRIDSAGNVGIGTSSPSAKLHLQGAGAAAVNTDFIYRPSGDNTNNYQIVGLYNLSGSTSGAFPNQSVGFSSDVNGGFGVSGGFVLNTDTNGGPLIFGTSNTERMRINSSGNVGIGTSSPTTGMHLYGSGQTTANIADSGNTDAFLKVSHADTNAGSGGGILFSNVQGDTAGSVGFAAIKGLLSDGGNNTAGHLAFSTRNSSGDAALTERMRIDSSGNLKFNSGYGSVATAYGVRAWVNFNGTGTVAIRDSGNVSSITDNGTGNYTVNFTNAMPDSNYSLVGTTQYDQSNSTATAYLMGIQIANTTNPLQPTSALIWGRYGVSTVLYDQTTCCVAIFR